MENAPAAVPVLNPNLSSPNFRICWNPPTTPGRRAVGIWTSICARSSAGWAVEINRRGHQFRVIGEPHAVAVAVAVLEALYRTTATDQSGANFHLFFAGSGDAAVEAEPETVLVVIRTRRGLIRGRGPNQQRYLWNIQHHDLNLGRSAGTGKPIWRWRARCGRAGK